MYKHFALLGFVLFWTTAAYMVKKWQGSKSMSLSKHAASHPVATVLFGATIIVSMTLYLLFIFKWFEPTFHLGKYFSYLNIVIATGFSIAALIPDTNGLPHRIHHHVAYTAAWLLMLPMAMLSIASTVIVPLRIVALIGFITMFVLWIRFLTIKNTRERHLIYQIVYFLIFDVTILLTTYIS